MSVKSKHWLVQDCRFVNKKVKDNTRKDVVNFY